MWGIKIDLRKKKLITDDRILSGIKEGRVWVDKSEGNYDVKTEALLFKYEHEAIGAITEEYEMVSAILN